MSEVKAQAPKDFGLTTQHKSGTSFTEKLSAEALAFFSMVANKPFSQQAVHFLNAYWAEIGNQAEFIYSVAWDIIKYADMHCKGIQLIYKYDEGNDLDFDIALYFYEQLCKFCEEPKNKNWREGYPISQPEMLTGLKRKQELRDKVDVNFDGRVSFLEYLLYQYKDFANPADFCQRSMSSPDEHPEIRKARLALEEVNKRIRAYEEEKARLEADSLLPGVKGLGAKNLLAQLDASPLKEELNKALITAEAAVRIASKKYGGSAFGGTGDGSGGAGSSDGAIWWMNRDLEEKKKRYGPSKK
ncbi:actin bundling protein [Tieghemostelium lacteum]|uniref:Actin bundling protein n=1 Tax=Tieghemostelium lacteum TaxID=361077 RepID=A0A152A7V9_TIELA|nr:actin bundling protein [Tieghemostelium lacteum]|eukprot:KYR02323.1 actin bundling protein [Tieghemostelium lacteum]